METERRIRKVGQSRRRKGKFWFSSDCRCKVVLSLNIVHNVIFFSGKLEIRREKEGKGERKKIMVKARET